jgi:hypothetical protein
MAEHSDSRLLSISDKAYHSLLYVYPASHRHEYGPWMEQLFRDLCRDALQRGGALGLIELWIRTLSDTAHTALVEHIDEQKQKLAGLLERQGLVPAVGDDMTDTTALDRQLSDFVYVLVKALRSGYSLPQSLGVMIETAPEPASRAFRGWQADLEAGCTYEEAFANLQTAWPSPYLAQIVEAILQNRESGDTLAAQIVPFAERIYQAVGSDEAFYPEMRRQAEYLGGPLPDRVRESTEKSH